MDAFYSIYSQGMARVSVCTLPLRLASPMENARAIAQLAAQCAREGSVCSVFPELCLTGYSIDDLRQQSALLKATEEAIGDLISETRALNMLLVVGAPVRHRDALYNCAIVLQGGQILGVVPKSFLPDYAEFYESRHFSAGWRHREDTVTFAGATAPFGVDLLFRICDVPGFTLGIEICEDLWVPSAPHTHLALAGATVIANLSASSVTIGKSETRHLLCRSASLKTISAYLYAAAGEGESTTDLAWDGQVAIYELGEIIAESERFPVGACLVHADIDLERIAQERLRQRSFEHAQQHINDPKCRIVEAGFEVSRMDIGLRRTVPRFPYVPSDSARLAQDCYEAWTIQVTALTQRLKASGASGMVIGVSGGLDSTLALLVCVRVAQQLEWTPSAIHAYTMPGFGTGRQSRSYAHELMRALKVEPRELDIRPGAQRMLEDLGHPYADGKQVFDTTFENVQAGLRTDYLFRIANQVGGLVIGTGDLSELALGWCTYGVGDQMSHYNVNAGMPKTLIQHLLRWLATEKLPYAEVAPVIGAVLEAEISPELIPGDEGAVQKTEDVIGPYALQDFNLYFTLRYGLKPSKIAFLALHAWAGKDTCNWPPGYPEKDRKSYTLPDIKHWLEVFVGRFFGFSQFKRSAMPNGPKISHGGALSPRGDWRMPSDSNAQIWLQDVKQNIP